jgi:MazG family protein
VEEAYEVLDAIDGGDPKDLSEELGDLLLQVVLQAEIGSEKGEFALGDVMRAISHKLISRHPHVFGDVQVANAKEVITNWERIKQGEKMNRGLFDGLPRAMPALQRSCRIGEKAARVGFDWPDSNGVRQKVDEELAELDEAVQNGDKAHIEHELGDLLFAVVQWGRHLGCQPEESLSKGCARFLSRFAQLERLIVEDGKLLKDCTLDELEQAWQRAKTQ